MRFEPLHPVFGAQLTGVDIREPLDDATIRAIDDAMAKYAILLVRGQPMTPDQQMAFTRRFGPLDLGFRRVKTAPGPSTGHRFEYQELADISNVEVDESIAKRDSRKIISNIANQFWHADSSFQKPRARYSMLHAVRLPGSGGNTEYVDLRNAYDRLDDAMKRRLEGLVAEHFALHSRFMLGDTDYSPEQIAAIPPVYWPIVQTHAASGRKHLFIGAHTREVVGMATAEARMLLWDLLEHATLPQYVYSHQWQVGDLVIWDNRCTLHRGRPYDLSTRRELRRSTTLDADAIEQAAAQAA